VSEPDLRTRAGSAEIGLIWRLTPSASWCGRLSSSRSSWWSSCCEPPFRFGVLRVLGPLPRTPAAGGGRGSRLHCGRRTATAAKRIAEKRVWEREVRLLGDVACRPALCTQRIRRVTRSAWDTLLTDPLLPAADGQSHGRCPEGGRSLGATLRLGLPP